LVDCSFAITVADLNDCCSSVTKGLDGELDLDKPKKRGAFTENSGKQLSGVEQEAEICSLNPLARQNGIFGGAGTTRTVPTKPFIHLAAATHFATAIADATDNEGEGGNIKKVGSTSNSTNTSMPHHLSFVFNCNCWMEFVCVMVNVPTGLHTGGFAGKIHALLLHETSSSM
jgi:hypothetical protein